MSQTFNVSDNLQILVRHSRDRVTIIGWEDADRVEVDCAARQEGDQVVIENERRVTIRAPRNATVLVENCKANLRLEELTGAVTLTDIDGDVALRSLQAVTARDIDGDLSARGVATINLAGALEGDLAARDVKALSADQVEGDLALSQIGAVKLHRVEGDVTLSQASGPILIDAVEGDFVASGVRQPVNVPDVSGDAVISISEIAELNLRAEGDVVLNLPENANAEVELDADDDIVARGDIEISDEDEHHVRGTLGKGGPKIRAEAGGDLVLRVNGGSGTHVHARTRMRSRVRPNVDLPDFAEMGEQIAQQVRASVHESMQGKMRESIKAGMRHAIHIQRHAREERGDRGGSSSEPAKPHGPAAGSPERQAILDSIGRGELSVDDAIKKLRGEE